MIFMTRDGNVVVTTKGLGWSAYQKRDSPMGSCPPFLLMFSVYNFRGKYM
ncbi:hypothetical protein Hanom_Chr01g00051901 [Helianthus anomalus]